MKRLWIAAFVLGLTPMAFAGNDEPTTSIEFKKDDHGWSAAWSKFKTALASGDKATLLSMIYDEKRKPEMEKQIDYLMANHSIIKEFISLQAYENYGCKHNENIAEEADYRVCMFTESGQAYQLTFGVKNGEYKWIDGIAK